MAAACHPLPVEARWGGTPERVEQVLYPAAPRDVLRRRRPWLHRTIPRELKFCPRGAFASWEEPIRQVTSAVIDHIETFAVHP
jgi:hypothetical protein